MDFNRMKSPYTGSSDAIPLYTKDLNPRDIKIGWISAIVTVILVLIIFFLVTYQIADPAPQDVLVNTETTLEELELKELKVANLNSLRSLIFKVLSIYVWVLGLMKL